MADWEDKIGREVWGDTWDAPTDPRHGGKMTPEQMAHRISELETCLRDFIALERAQTPRMDGKLRMFAYISPGPALAATLDAARDLLGE